MSESKTQCVACGAPILQRTADEHDGLCVPCHRKAAAIPPDDFKIAPDLAQRLVSINEDPMDYREMAWAHGAEFLHGFIDKFDERNSLYNEWSPRLSEFAKKCRKEHPPPTDDSLSNRDREMQRIYEAKLARPQVGRDNTVAICRMPLVAIPVAQRTWSQDKRRMIRLTPEEKPRWDEIYSHPKNAFWWFAHFWWNVDDSPERQRSHGELTFSNWDENDVPSGHSPWLVTVGHSHGPLAGAGHTELWSWNGKKATFVKNIGNWIS